MKVETIWTIVLCLVAGFLGGFIAGQQYEMRQERNKGTISIPSGDIQIDWKDQ